MARILQPPAPLDLAPGERSVFLAGTIEVGQAKDWQATFCAALAAEPITVLNPRRAEWDASWSQTTASPPFREQVEWELNAQEQATLIAMYFVPGTRSPISLLELGLFARSGRLVVCCPEGFWRKGNVDIVCARYAIPTVATLGELIAYAQTRLGR